MKFFCTLPGNIQIGIKYGISEMSDQLEVFQYGKQFVKCMKCINTAVLILITFSKFLRQ